MNAVESPSSVGELYDRFGALAYRLAVSITGNPAIAERVVSEAFSATWRKGVTSNSRFFSSVMRAVRAGAMQNRTAYGRRKSFEATLGTEDGRGHEAAVTSALAALSEGERSALALAYFGGLGVEAIASELRQPIPNVKANLQAALHNLRSVLTERGVAV
ncbi:MAG TPA: sigma factor-like helix-turn-helix DNA-binding protein [Gemmatimonadaceae bacterium]|nr:sigma factor-like helix-turn-helix DNA-binding protein [Gemmatimonadaceae bacterium]